MNAELRAGKRKILKSQDNICFTGSFTSITSYSPSIWLKKFLSASTIQSLLLVSAVAVRLRAIKCR